MTILIKSSTSPHLSKPVRLTAALAVGILSISACSSSSDPSSSDETNVVVADGSNSIASNEVSNSVTETTSIETSNGVAVAEIETESEGGVEIESESLVASETTANVEVELEGAGVVDNETATNIEAEPETEVVTASESTPEENSTETVTSGTGIEPTQQIPNESQVETATAVPEQPTLATTSVTFDITVPVYVSNALQVRVNWGDTNTSAAWVTDESWSVTSELPTNTEDQLTVTFSDENGAITLGQFDQSFTTGTEAQQVHSISADQFDIESWDDDGNGVNNLTQLTQSAIAQPTVPSNTSGSFDFIDVAADVIHSAAACQLTRLGQAVQDVAFIIEETSTYTWPDTDYYQVQIVSNWRGPTEVFGTACEGGSECKLLPGMHNVINHTTGERSILQVPRVSAEDNPNATQIPDRSYTSTDPEYAVASDVLTRTQYQCENGGSFTRESGRTNIRTIVYEPENYVFDQCRMTVRTGLIPDGNYTLNGNLETSRIGNMYDANRWLNYDNFSIVGDDGLEYHVQGDVLAADGYYEPSRRTASIASYLKKLPNDQIGESMSNVEFSYKGYEGYLLNIEGVVQSDKTADQQVTISTNSTLNYEIKANSNEVITQFNGSMEMLADGGSFLYLTGNSAETYSDHGANFSMDLEHTTESGDVLEGSLTRYRPTSSTRRCAYDYFGPAGFRRNSLERAIP